MRTATRRMWVCAAAVSVLLAVGGVGTSVARAQPPLGPASNLDFEGPATPAGLPQGWGGGGEGYELALDKAVAHSGKQSGRLAYVGKGEPAQGSFGGLNQVISPDAFRGQRVRLSGYVKTDKVEGDGAVLWMRVDGPQQGKILSFDNMADRSIVGTTDWKKYEIVLDVPKEAATIVFGLLLPGKGTAWVDDLKLEKVAPDTPVTDPSQRTTPHNTDFEAAATRRRLPPAWLGGGDGYEFAIDQKVAHGGKQSARVQYVGKAEPTETTFAALSQTILADAFRGGKVRLSGFVKTDKVEGWSGLWLRIDGADQTKPPLAFDNMKTSNRAITGTTEWKKYEIVLDVPKEATRVVLGLLLSGKGTAWVDDVKVEKGGNP
jgi:hypothetical protein